MAVAQYTVRALEPSDEREVLRLLGMSLGESTIGGRHPSFWRWKHVSNIFGPSFSRVARDESGDLMGMRAFMQWGLKSGDQTLRAVRAVDTATHPEYRRLGIFSKLTRRVIDDVTDDGVDLVFNTPNNQVLPGYLKLGWQYVSVVHPLLKVLNYPRFGVGMLRNKLGVENLRRYDLTDFFREEPTSAASLLERQSEVEVLVAQNEDTWDQKCIRTDRSLNYLRWRYVEHPTISYWVTYVEQAGQLLACAIYRTNTRFGLKEVVLCELLLNEADPQLLATLLKKVRAEVRADYLVSYFPNRTFQRGVLQRQGFKVVPRRGMNFAVRPLGSQFVLDPLEFKNWGLTMGDLELF